VRLLYVALTRARDRLIVCAHARGWKESAEGKPQLDANGSRLQPLSSFLSDCLCGGNSLARILDAKALDATVVRPQAAGAAVRDWGVIARRQYEELAALLRETPSSIVATAAARVELRSHTEDMPREEREDDAVPSRSARLGIAFHDAMEKIDFGCDERAPALALEAGMRQKLDSEAIRVLEQLVHFTRNSSLVERARRAQASGGRVWRELPFVRPLSPSLGGGIEEGKIDLLFEEQGMRVLVDYKTDECPAGVEEESFFREKHGGQILQYVKALESMGVKVNSAYLLMARTGTAIEIPI
jgi:ATP-dependent exoDNAse (exonuclease V) beta subunit